MLTPQLPLGIRLDDAATFDNYYNAEPSEPVQVLRHGDEPFVYLWGNPGCGKTHLLQAVCAAGAAAGVSVMYLPLADPELHSPAIVEDIESRALVCIDDIHAVAGNREWEEALLHFYNRLRERGGKLRVAARQSPTALPIRLADLASRLSWGATFYLQMLSDDQKRIAMQRRASRRGFELQDDVATFLMARYPRDMHSLFTLLDRLDIASLQAQRRLTIPFVKRLLNER